MLETFGCLVREPLVAVEGVVHVPDGPGLGVSVDEEAVRAMSTSVVEVRL
jgi:L-alanine-DL-glutamate epimerase-like enolase superfamily enzyme